MRMVVGICIIVDGYPIIFFFRDALKLAPGSTVFTAVALAFGLVLMVPFTILRRMYRPNMMMFWMGLSFIGLCIFYMFFYNGHPGIFDEYGKDMVYYAYVLIFLFLLINTPNDIIRVFISVVVVFTLVSNLGLIYSLITNPNWAIGQRATITLGENDEGGNPHVFARNAVMGLIACGIWLVQPKTATLFRLFSFFCGVVNLAVLILAGARSAILSVLIAFALFLYFNVRPAQVKAAVRGLVGPIPLLIAFLGFVGVYFFFQRYYDAYAILYGYVLSFAERNLENIYAFMGFKAAGADYKAVLDDSVANRTVSAAFFLDAVAFESYMMVFGYGYKYTYLDVPVLEAATSFGLLGLYLFGGIVFISLYYSIRAMYRNPNPLNVFLAYFYIYIFVSAWSGGRPYDITFWFPLALMIRFMGVDHLFPAYLQNQSTTDIESVDSKLLASTSIQSV